MACVSAAPPKPISMPEGSATSRAIFRFAASVKEATEAAENKRKEKLKKIEDERRAIEEMKAKRAFNDS